MADLVAGRPDIAEWCERAGNILTPGQALRFLRTSFGLHVLEVAKVAGVNPAVLWDVENDATQYPSPEWLGAVAEAIMRLRHDDADEVCLASMPITSTVVAICSLTSGHRGAHTVEATGFTWCACDPLPGPYAG